MSLFNYKISELHKKLKNKEITVTDLVNESLNKIDEVEEKVQAFLTVNKDNALQTAKQLDDKLASEEVNSPLFGIPVAIKDNIITKGLTTTSASKMLENFEPVYNATVMERLQEAGAVTVGKTNMDEFAMGSTTETSYFKLTHNPWNLDFVPGGSSGGSAAAVASGEALYSLGTDTGGSIRQPAAFCGVVGLKPTYGRISRYGVVAFASSLDQVGPITRTVEDNAYVLQALAGVDEKDSMTANVEVPNFVAALTKDIKGLKIAVPKEYIGEGVSEEARQSVLDALKVFEDLGATWEEVSLPHSIHAPATYSIISSGEASANLARFDGVRYGYRSPNANNLEDLYKNTRAEGFGDEVKHRIVFGTYVLSAQNYERYYKKAQRVRTLIKEDFEKVFENYDVVIGPTTAGPAYKLQDGKVNTFTNDMLTTPVNLANLPAISIPCGFSNGLPLGLQIIGKHFDEANIYRVAHAFEQATNFHKEKPQL